MLRPLSSCLAFALTISVAMTGQGSAAPIVVSGTGADTASLSGTVTTFRNGLGTLNSNVVGSFGSGRREINWDGVPDASAAPNNLPANFFNVNSPRGVIFNTAGSGFQVSAKTGNPSSTSVLFGNLNPIYPNQFTTFSPQRLFTALGSTITDVNFFIPGSNTPALTRGFGAVFTDVDLPSTTSIQFFDVNNTSLGSFFAPTLNNGLSFVGADFGSNIVARVRITSGNTALGPTETGGIDVVAMDDFIYGEPVDVPEPGGLLVLLTVTLGLGLGRLRPGASLEYQRSRH